MSFTMINGGRVPEEDRKLSKRTEGVGKQAVLNPKLLVNLKGRFDEEGIRGGSNLCDAHGRGKGIT